MTKLEMIDAEIDALNMRLNELWVTRKGLMDEKTTVKLRITARAKEKLLVLARAKNITMGEAATKIILGL